MSTDPTNHDVFVRLTCHRDALVIEGPDPEFAHEHWIPNGGTKIGCVLVDTRTHLGVSCEALAFLRRVRPSRDDVGDVMWWKSDADFCFGWLGNAKTIKDVDADGQRNYAVPDGAYVVIPNDVPAEAVKVIDDARNCLE